MAYEESLRSISLDADSSLALYTGVPGTPGAASPNFGKQYRFVKITGAHQVGVVTAGSDVVVGVIQNKPQVVGQAATVAISGVSGVISGGAITAGQQVIADATGKAVAAGAGVTGLGVAIQSVGAADQLVSVLLRVN